MDSSTHSEVDSSSEICALEKIVKLSDLLLSGVESDEYTWINDLNEALKSTITTPANLTFSFRPGARGYHSAQSNSLHQLLTLLRDSMLHMRHIETTEILKSIISGCRVSMPLALENAIHRSGLEIMYNLRDLAQPPLLDFLNQLKVVKSAINPQRLALEQFIHTLSTQTLDEAVECISTLPKISHQMSSTEQSKQISLLYKAYKGLSLYLEWERLRNTLTSQSASQSFHHFNQKQQCEELAENALSEWSSLSERSGVWDIFISNQVELLHYLRRSEKALDILKNYKQHNDDNPNAYRYLIDFHRHQGNTEESKTLLIEYCRHWPSDKTAALLLLEELDLSEDSECKMSVQILFSLIDYSCHKDDVELWKKFEEFICTAGSMESFCRNYIGNEWREREFWWLPFHFANMESKTKTKLSIVKSSVLKLLQNLKHNLS